MQSIRVGKDIEVRWPILTNGQEIALEGRDLTLFARLPTWAEVRVDFTAEDNVAIFIIPGVEQEFTGTYSFTMWENYGKDGQTMVDCCDAFRLVDATCMEGDVKGLNMGTVELPPSNIVLGVPGPRGYSAYEIYKQYHPESDITEEEYARNPVDAADGAFVAIDRIEKKEKQIDAAEQQREQEEQIRYTSENTRVENETLRINAEEQRERNEQTRIADEQRRIDNEQSRESAEKIREETVATATQKADTASANADLQAARAKSLADHPPKIVDVGGLKYWAFWDDATKGYVTSEFRADDGTIVQQVEGSAVSLDVKGGTMYVCGELTSLNIASAENSTKPSIIRFTSGATATQFSYPEDFNITGWTKPEENKSYTICILFGAGNMTYDE